MTMGSMDKSITIIASVALLGFFISMSILFITTAKVDINYNLGINLTGVNQSLLVETLKKTQPIPTVVTEEGTHSRSNYTCIPTEEYVNWRIMENRYINSN
jgi:hypothetical protein